VPVFPLSWRNHTIYPCKHLTRRVISPPLPFVILPGGRVLRNTAP
jgi:hypothetical protein